jgi:tetratricopeptide (TPR) repeat protein
MSCERIYSLHPLYYILYSSSVSHSFSLQQEYTRAYNAYSAALQLSPVGPSSHVFLSNRAAALLSLKRYNAAATDARRAIALAPTFGKAHARLGQALYFIKDYEGAVSAYQDAMDYEPDNQVTLTYLEKAKVKLDKQRRKLRGEDGGSVAPSMAGDASHMHYAPSVVTDDPRTNQHTLMHGNYRGSGAAALMKAAAARKQTSPSLSAASSTPSSYYLGSPQSPAALKNNSLLNQSLDPDFDEALRIQQVANKFLANKQYKAAIEEYTAALFLVPDDVNLSHELHLGRAHALNGSRRHERARNDALLANKLKVSPAAYSTLAKSYFYMKDYHACIEAFDECIKLLPAGETLGLFDRAYLEKAEAALEEDEASLNTSSWSKKSVVPKLPPPRFVARDEAIQSTPTLPSMPKEWPQQSPRDPKVFRCGVEREIVFLSEQLGIKLNRGSDGIVRVLSVTPSTPGSPLMRQGEIHLGDVIRECAGVDLRRPITNIMWGDTVALVKMAPRPISFLVARELSEIPPAVVEELQKAEGRGNMSSNGSVFSMFTSSTRPSNSNGDEPVRVSVYSRPSCQS